jgi:hypothetical protein
MHCWALGGAYGAMPSEDAAFVLDELGRFCLERDVDYHTYPMHEVTAHPDAPDVIRLFAPHLGQPYDPILTPGTPLASRDDWEEIVAAAKECGAKSLHVAFHGYGEEHDRQLNRPGAFEETCLAVQRAQESGLGTSANVFLTKSGLRDFGRLVDVLLDFGLGGVSIAPAAYTPTTRGRRYETLRPELDDLLPIAERAREAGDRDTRWSEIAAHTEAAWVECAFDRDFPPTGDEGPQRLVVRPNLDLYSGTTGVYRTRHGNLRRDGARTVLEHALAEGWMSEEALYFGSDGPPIAELAAQAGDPAGTRVYFEAESPRRRWRDAVNG